MREPPIPHNKAAKGDSGQLQAGGAARTRSCFAGGDTEVIATWKNSLAVSCKLEYILFIQPSRPTQRPLPGRNEGSCLHRGLGMLAHSAVFIVLEREASSKVRRVGHWEQLERSAVGARSATERH